MCGGIFLEVSWTDDYLSNLNNLSNDNSYYHARNILGHISLWIPELLCSFDMWPNCEHFILECTYHSNKPEQRH
jgi:hypothetical protein